MSVTVYNWRIRDKRTGRWRELRWKMAEKDAAQWAVKEGVAIERSEGGGEVRYPYEAGSGRYVDVSLSRDYGNTGARPKATT